MDRVRLIGQTCGNAGTQSWESKVGIYYDSSTAILLVILQFFYFIRRKYKNIQVIPAVCRRGGMTTHVTRFVRIKRLQLLRIMNYNRIRNRNGETVYMNKKIIRNILIITFLAVIIAITACIFINRYRKAEINKQSFSEMHIPSLSDMPKDNINDVLQSLYVENNEVCGFADKSYKSIDLYTADSIVKLAGALPKYDIGLLKNNFLFLSATDVTKLDLLNLLYYVDLCGQMDIDLDYDMVNNELCKYYDKNQCLFFLDSESDSAHIKLVITALVKKTMKNNLDEKTFELEKGIVQVYDNYEFLTGNSSSLYNSGGDILHCISVFGMNETADMSELAEWFEYWKKTYEDMSIDTSTDALMYSEFLNIAVIFDEKYSREKLDNYYNALDEQKVEEIQDLHIIFNIMDNMDSADNEKVNGLIINRINNALSSESPVTLETDLKSTVYGVLLSQYTGFSYDEDKIKAYINSIYDRDTSGENVYERSSNLYYVIILEQLVNNYEVDYGIKHIQKQIDDMLSEMDYSTESLGSDIISTRRLVEIVSDLRIFDADIKLTQKQINKIKKGIKAALQQEGLKNSVLINDMYIIDRILSLNLVSDEALSEVYNSLTVDGGSRSTAETDAEPDITSTYQFFSSLEMMNNYENIEEQRKFISTHEIKDGLYVNEINDSQMELSVIAYGNSIKYVQTGGTSGDKVVPHMQKN